MYPQRVISTVSLAEYHWMALKTGTLEACVPMPRLTTAPSYYTLKAREGSSDRHYPCAVFLDKIAGKTSTPYRRNPNDNAHG